MKLMKGIKNAVGRMMNVVMLSCEDATLLMTKKQYGQISFIKNMQLKMHLLSCKLCRRFNIHNEKIHSEWEAFEEENKSLSPEKKVEIERKLKAELKNF